MEKNLLLLGKRWCGKTTLTYYLTVEQGGEYVSDDCVYIKNKQYYGFCTPLPIRNFNDRNPESNKNIFASVVDGEEVSRTLLLPSKVLNHVSDIGVVLFPKYHTDVKRG